VRGWHLWLGVLLALIFAGIAVTGILAGVAALVPEEAARTAASVPEGFVCPEGWRCIAPASEGSLRGRLGEILALHSGQRFGSAGALVSILAGAALLFFSISGLWFNLATWRRKRRSATRDRWFWK